MKKRVIWIIALIIIGSAYSQEINLNYPKSIDVNQEFNIGLELSSFKEGVYDVKIEILNGEKNIAKRLWNGEWKSTYYWMIGAIDTSKSEKGTFLFKITENYAGGAEIKVKIRSNNSNKEFSVYTIQVISSQQSQNNNSKQEVNNEESNPQPSTTTSDSSEIRLEINWNTQDIVNGGEFDLEIKARDLENKEYDAKVWIEADGKVISQAYNEGEEKWKSGKYYLNGIFNGPGVESATVRLRINEENKDFIGNAKIYLKLREGEQIDEEINILKNKEQKTEIENESRTNKNDVKITQKEEIIENSERITGEVIYLGKKQKVDDYSEKQEIREVVYESKNEVIKNYSVIGFAILCVVICLLVVWRRIR
jgi:hypothetical protein